MLRVISVEVGPVMQPILRTLRSLAGIRTKTTASRRTWQAAFASPSGQQLTANAVLRFASTSERLTAYDLSSNNGVRSLSWVRSRRRDLSTKRGGSEADWTGPSGRDRGNTPLGKGYDIVGEEPDSRAKCVIAGYDDWGFQLGDGVDARGSIIALPNTYLLWQPKRVSEVTIESLRLVELVKPSIDLLVVGLGETMMERLDPDLVKHLASKGIRVEQMDTVNACSTFNVLNSEDRRVAAALIQLSTEDEPEG